MVINEPDLLRDIIVKDFNIFPDHRKFHMGSSKLGQSLFFMAGDTDWKRVRTILSPAFSSGKLRAMLSHIESIGDRFVHTLAPFAKSGETIDIRKYVGAFAMDVISACAYGINISSIDNHNHPMVMNVKRILATDIRIGLMLSIITPGLARLLRAEPFDPKALQYFDELTEQILTERKKFNKYSKSDSEKSDKDLGYDSISDGEPESESKETGIKPSKKSVGKLSYDEMVAQGILFFIAGYDTTSASLTHAIYYLSQHPECQQRLYEELKTCDEFTYEKLVHLKYLNAVINETLRMAPPFLRVFRDCVQDYTLGNTGIKIPAGTSIEIYPYALHRDPKYWSQPNDFIPDRWFEPIHHPYAYLPFGGGPRICIGQRFSINEMQMCLAKLIFAYEFSLAPGFTIDYYKGTIMMTPKQVLCNIKPRN
ncbi:unnamed protein product [Oppiella nova]|uniref:Cytochrome P450 n=1 Tax=Oppiella nova TaxID=334625 RepID=A0A7R9M6M2_9ACAR|nr:unnamed protein product [Oppiella nova]CAG2171470.1 unnamed protein product [Oppiella nova]